MDSSITMLLAKSIMGTGGWSAPCTRPPVMTCVSAAWSCTGCTEGCALPHEALAWIVNGRSSVAPRGGAVGAGAGVGAWQA